MGGHVIGLDIGTHAVTAAELSLGRKPTLHRFGQVALPPGAVNAGEVVDPAAVTEALKRLWRDAGFKSRQVVLGIGNRKVVVRQTEMPELPHDEMRAAITFQARELIPIAIEDAQFDVKVLAPVVTGEAVEGEPVDAGSVEAERRVRVMIAAAPRDMISGLLDVVEAAGLQPTAINLVPLAMIKALGDTTGADPAEHHAGIAEAIVAIGAGTTNIVIHEGGIPSFVRILDQGGNSLTRAIADEMHLDWDEAEELKRNADPMAYGDEELAARIIAGHLAPFIEEIRGSLDYYQVQHAQDGLRRVVLTGAGSRAVGLPERLGVLLGVPVVQGHVLQRLTAGKLDEADLAAAEDLLSVAVGLGLDSQLGTGTDHALNLLPPEILHRRADRRQKTLAMAAVGLLALALMGVWFLKHSEAASTENLAAQTERSNANLRSRITPDTSAPGAKAGVAERNKLAAQATKGEISWSTVLSGVAGAMPADVWWTSFQGDAGSAKEPATVSVTAKGRNYAAAAAWVDAVGQSPLVSGLWVPNTNTSSESDEVMFTSTFQLTPRAQSARQAVLADLASGKAKPAPSPVKAATPTTTTAPKSTTVPPSTTTSTSPIAPAGDAQATVDGANQEQSSLDQITGSGP